MDSKHNAAKGDGYAIYSGSGTFGPGEPLTREKLERAMDVLMDTEASDAPYVHRCDRCGRFCLSDDPFSFACPACETPKVPNSR